MFTPGGKKQKALQSLNFAGLFVVREVFFL
jgi:hypothetical protein